jgi:hypothetical protein
MHGSIIERRGNEEGIARMILQSCSEGEGGSVETEEPAELLGS